jgi:hypothetical protein
LYRHHYVASLWRQHPSFRSERKNGKEENKGNEDQ